MDTSDITTTEEWRDIPGYEGLYRVSNLGRVKSLPRYNARGEFRPGGIRKTSPCNQGYCDTPLTKDGRMSHGRVHALVLLAFVGERPLGADINHRDGDKTNNRLENLEYCTHQQNMDHARLHGLITMQGSKHPLSKLHETDIPEIFRLVQQGHTKAAIARMFGVDRKTVSNIVNRKRWTHV